MKKLIIRALIIRATIVAAFAAVAGYGFMPTKKKK